MKLKKKKGYINLNPLQTGGKIPEEIKDTLKDWMDGYSICDFCPGRLDLIENPPFKKFVHETLPEFIDVDLVRITNGAREGKFIVMHALRKLGNVVILRLLVDYIIN